jgi:hypothetical protein
MLIIRTGSPLIPTEGDCIEEVASVYPMWRALENTVEFAIAAVLGESDKGTPSQLSHPVGE